VRLSARCPSCAPAIDSLAGRPLPETLAALEAGRAARSARRAALDELFVRGLADAEIARLRLANLRAARQLGMVR